MLCSMSSGKSGSKWLDRLRSSKGFPAGNDLDLEQFLSHHNPDAPSSSGTELSDINVGPKLSSIAADTDEEQQKKDTSRRNGDREWFGIMSNVLAELFNMGDSNDSSRIRKSCRKQPNPRICVLSASSNVAVESDTQLRDGCDSSCIGVKQKSNSLRTMKEDNVDVGSADAEDDEKSYADLSEFSRTEVTVIDSSCPSWKSEKLLFRKKNVWKFREKKSKSTNSGVKKRKANLLGDENEGGEKKLKRCSSSKDGNGKQRMLPSNEGDLQNDKTDEDPGEALDIPGQVPTKRFPRKSKKGSCSVILIKGIPTKKKPGTNIPKSCLKLSQKQ